MRILVVDDEKIIVDIFEEYLEMCGHTPVVAYNGRQALDLFLEQPDAFDLLITDINMPILNGIELAKQIRTLRPLTPILFISARLDSEFSHEIRQLEPCKWLKKPFQLEQLNKLICAYSEFLTYRTTLNA